MVHSVTKKTSIPLIQTALEIFAIQQLILLSVKMLNSLKRSIRARQYTANTDTTYIVRPDEGLWNTMRCVVLLDSHLL